MTSNADNEFGAITMPTKPTTGRIRTQDHPKRQPAEGYNSKDDAKAEGYGKLTGSKTDHSHRNYGVLKGRKY